MSDAEAVDLLWTGGWDSTFRLLQLLWTTEVTVRPHYLVDEDRRSLAREMKAIKEIREDIRNDPSDHVDRLLPTEYGSYLATEVESRYRKARRALNEEVRVGPQYEVLASYAAQNKLDALELCVQKHEAQSHVLSVLQPHLAERRTPAGFVHSLEEDVEGPLALYERFAFPLYDYTKLDMEREAEEVGFLSLIELSWTCHDPVLGLPCGACIPCNIAREEGLGRRVGWLGPLLHRVRWRFRE